jgi:hypothetical protein
MSVATIVSSGNDTETQQGDIDQIQSDSNLENPKHPTDQLNMSFSQKMLSCIFDVFAHMNLFMLYLLYSFVKNVRDEISVAYL